MYRNILLTIEYDGTPFSGWQRQPGRPTVQGSIEEALSMVCGKPVTIAGTSRTDAGVHAYGQRASFDGDFGIPTENIKYALNNALPESIHITAAEEMPEGFHARFDSKGKTYIYKILNTKERDPFRRNYYCFVKKPLDMTRMRKAAEDVTGTHDFVCFQASGSTEKETTVRTVSRLDLMERGADEIDIEITGDGFLYNMVRIIAGTLIDIGTGKMEPDEMKRIIEGRDRTKAGHTAPPQGLYLKEIYY